eukprot:171103-Prorocentrum_minimum.AAC.7
MGLILWGRYSGVDTQGLILLLRETCQAAVLHPPSSPIGLCLPLRENFVPASRLPLLGLPSDPE